MHPQETPDPRDRPRGAMRPKRVEDYLAIAEKALQDAADKMASMERGGQAQAPAGLAAQIQRVRQQAQDAGIRYRQSKNMVTSISGLANELRYTRKLIRSSRFMTFRNYAGLVAVAVAYGRAAKTPMSLLEAMNQESGERDRFLLIETAQGQVSFGLTLSLFRNLSRIGLPTDGAWDGHSTDQKTQRITALLGHDLSADEQEGERIPDT